MVLCILQVEMTLNKGGKAFSDSPFSEGGLFVAAAGILVLKSLVKIFGCSDLEVCLDSQTQ